MIMTYDLVNKKTIITNEFKINVKKNEIDKCVDIYKIYQQLLKINVFHNIYIVLLIFFF